MKFLNVRVPVRFSLSFAVAALLLSSCASGVEKSGVPVAANPKTSVIHLGMPFAEAEARLTRYGASEVGLQVLLTKKAAERGAELHLYRLGEPNALEVHSGLAAGVRIVTYLAVSKNSPKTWQSKTDPERDRFLQSFVQRDSVDLENLLNGSNDTKTAAAPATRN